MRIVHSLADLRAALAGQRPVSLVPTMGNLHAGHLSLVEHARQRRGILVTSIFVNGLQFGPQDDFSRYPRTLDQDCRLLAGAGCDVVFAPSDEQMYPQPQEFRLAPPSAMADIFEGASRPGFFVGVCTVVMKLFHIVQPDVAFFGKKDYQQLLIVRRMVEQMALSIDIVGCETVRDANGLALSSRNSYLSPGQLIEGAELSRTLRAVASDVRTGGMAWPDLERRAMESLRSRQWQPDYVAIRRRTDLRLPAPSDPLIVIGAARLGGTRLIDNYEVSA
ncbi:MAG: pantoate--beta-alanine ligase [Steroidobacterales bacterium]